MSDYGKLMSSIWSDPEFTALDAGAQQLYCLLISYPTRNLAGVLPLTLRRWANSTRGATVASVTDALRDLAASRFVVVDWNTEEVLIRTFIRNDEVHKQPNLMTAARRFCLQVDSPTLKWALHAELTRLPAHKDDAKTQVVANALVDGVPEPPDEGLPEGLTEGFAEGLQEGPGVGGYLSGVRVAPTPTPATSTHTAGFAEPVEPPTPQRLPARTNNGVELARRQFSNLPARSATAYHIAEAFSAALPVPIEAGLLSGIGVQIDKCLKRGIPPPAIAAGLKAWTDSDSWSPTQIPNFVHKANNRSKPTNGKPTEKALGYDDALAELLTEVQTL